MEDKYQLTSSSVETLMVDIKYKLYCLTNNIDIPKFDFDYYLEVRNDSDLPFFGDLKLVIKIFDMYYGVNGEKPIPITEIIKTLKLNYQPTSLSRVVGDLKLSVLKYKDGITSNNRFEEEEIEDYYNKHCDTMPAIERKVYERFFRRYRQLSIFKYYINIGDLSKDDVTNILKKYGHLIR